MPDITKICITHVAKTTKINNGNVAVEEAILKNVSKPLFVLFAYGGKNGRLGFELAADYKKRRLQKKYPEAEIRIITGFKYPSHFKAEWTKLYNELTNPETAGNYALWQVHYFGHGAYNALNLEPEGGVDGAKSQIFFNDEDNMERLPWQEHEGIFVLHSCRGGAYEDSFDDKKIKAQICLAKTISMKQKTRCLGQTIYANYAIDLFKIRIIKLPLIDPLIELIITGGDEAQKFRYRPYRAINYGYSEYTNIDRALWGYALLTGETYSKMSDNKEKYEEMERKLGVENPSYPIYEEIKKLSSKNQILPCRVFNRGKLEERIVEVDVFNQNDMEYI